MAQLHDSGQAGALSSDVIVTPEILEQGVMVVRSWMDENWSAIQDGCEPMIAQVVRDVLSIAHTLVSPDL